MNARRTLGLRIWSAGWITAGVIIWSIGSLIVGLGNTGGIEAVIFGLVIWIVFFFVGVVFALQGIIVLLEGVIDAMT